LAVLRPFPTRRSSDLGSTTGTLGAGNVSNSGTLVFNRSNALSVGNVISGAGNLVQNGGGTTSLTASSSYSGTTTINSGVLSVTTDRKSTRLNSSHEWI